MTVAFIHANTGQTVHVATPLIFCAYYSQTSKCTHVLSAGGAIIPVTAKPEEVMKAVNDYWEGVRKNGNPEKRN